MYSFLAGHWLARRVTADWLQLDAARIALDRHPDGRPLLLVDDAPASLSISLSHSGDWLAIALATVPVGIDIELPRRLRDLPGGRGPKGLFCTIETRADRIAEALAAGADDYVMKPFDGEILHSKLAEVGAVQGLS